MTSPKDASLATRAAHANIAAQLPIDDGQDFAAAQKGSVATLADAQIPGAWSMEPYGFLKGERPDTVNPSLWRQARLNAIHGLFQVCDGIFQVRGFDISNITFIEGEDGFIVIDPLTSAEPAAAALKLMREHRGDKPVTGIIYTHSHVDHYGGVYGVLGDGGSARDIPIIAPEGFLKAAISENVLLGNAMGRRATYMYGGLLPKTPQGHVDSGLGKGVSTGKVGLVAPTVSISRTGERLTVDGVEIVFQVTPDTEAPAEMNFYFPKHRALCMAENCTCHLHNLYTPRGAQVRDARGWSHYIDEARRLWADDTDVLFASHHWPRWGSREADGFLRKQRDLYKFIHDQTLRMANHGMTPLEIGEVLELPPALKSEWYTRSYYGTLNHNAKAVYQRYLGWFDGNPANLHKLPPVEAGKRYVDLAGGSEALLDKARKAFERGEYRWVAELVNHLVFADPTSEAARALQADALEQLGYQSESGPWRDFYLTGAQELRNPRAPSAKPRQGSAGQLRSLDGDGLLDALSVRLNGPAAGDKTLSFNLEFEDTGERFAVSLENAVLRHETTAEAADVVTTRPVLIDLLTGKAAIADFAGTSSLRGSGLDHMAQLLTLIDQFDFWFEIVTP